MSLFSLLISLMHPWWIKVFKIKIHLTDPKLLYWSLSQLTGFHALNLWCNHWNILQWLNTSYCKLKEFQPFTHTLKKNNHLYCFPKEREKRISCLCPFSQIISFVPLSAHGPGISSSEQGKLLLAVSSPQLPDTKHILIIIWTHKKCIYGSR